MKSLYISIFCLSWIHVGSVLAYPIQDLNTALHMSNDRPQYYEAKEPQMTPLLRRLFVVYYKLMQAEQDGIIHNLIQNANDRQNHANTADIDKYDFSRDDSDKFPVTSGQSEENAFSAEISKRQQGWYIQYGKRDIGTSISDRGMNYHKREIPEDVSGIDDMSSSALIRGHNKLRAAKSELNSILPEDFDGLNSRNHLNNRGIHKTGLDSDRKRATGLVSLQHKSQKSKRQQGWYVPYGKRNGAVQPGN